MEAGVLMIKLGDVELEDEVGGLRCLQDVKEGKDKRRGVHAGGSRSHAVTS
jgi:hypothetical protein